MIFGGQFSSTSANSASSTLTLTSVNVAPNPVVLNMGGEVVRDFVGNAVITAPKTWALSNDTDALEFKFSFEIDGAHAMTMPADFIMSDALWNDATKTWTPFDPGIYQANASFNGTDWILSIIGPYA